MFNKKRGETYRDDVSASNKTETRGKYGGTSSPSNITLREGALLSISSQSSVCATLPLPFWLFLFGTIKKRRRSRSIGPHNGYIHSVGRKECFTFRKRCEHNQKKSF